MTFINGVLEKLTKDALGMKSDFDKLKSDLNNNVITSSSGDGMIKVDVNARCEVLKIEIDDTVFKKDDKIMLQELIKSTVNDALRKAEQIAVKELQLRGV